MSKSAPPSTSAHSSPAWKMIEEGHLGGAWILANTALSQYPGNDEAKQLLAVIDEKRAGGAPWDPPLGPAEFAILFQNCNSIAPKRGRTAPAQSDLAVTLP